MTAVYFDCFGIEYISHEILKKSKLNKILAIFLEQKIMNLLGVSFVVSI